MRLPNGAQGVLARALLCCAWLAGGLAAGGQAPLTPAAPPAATSQLSAESEPDTATAAEPAELEPGTYLRKLDGRDVLRLAGPTVPAWLPNGRQLLLATTNSLYRIDVDGTRKILLWRDPETVMLLNLRVSASGGYASALAIDREGAGRVRVWRLGNGKVVLDDMLYPKAVVDEPDAQGQGGSWLDAVMAWSPTGDLLAWAPQEFEGLAERTLGVKVYDAASERWATRYVERPVWSLVWHADRPSLILAIGDALGEADSALPPVTLYEISADGKSKSVLTDQVHGALPTDAPMTWLPRCGLFAWGQQFFGADGESAPPEVPDDECAPARLLWVSASGRDLLLAVSRESAEGECETSLMQGMTGARWDTFRRLSDLPVPPHLVLASADGARLVFVVGGYISE